VNVLLTGATGFIGSSLRSLLVSEGKKVRAACRRNDVMPKSVEVFNCGDIGPETDWTNALHRVTHVVHLASRVHRTEESSENPESEILRINVLGTERLARSAAEAGVHRFLYLSTAKVHGEGDGEPFRETAFPQPDNPYARSKWEAEKVLQRISIETGMEIVILRPPLVYGPGAKANFLKLMEAIFRGLPLPLGSVRNKRSFIFLDNLIDVIDVSLVHPEASGQTFLVSDGEDLSTPGLIRRTAKAMSKPCRVFPFPITALKLLGRLGGKGGEIVRLTESFRVDSGKVRETLSWSPPFSVEEGLQETVNWFLRQKHSSF